MNKVKLGKSEVINFTKDWFIEREHKSRQFHYGTNANYIARLRREFVLVLREVLEETCPCDDCYFRCNIDKERELCAKYREEALDE